MSNLWNRCPFPLRSHGSMPCRQSDILTSIGPWTMNTDTVEWFFGDAWQMVGSSTNKLMVAGFDRIMGPLFLEGHKGRDAKTKINTQWTELNCFLGRIVKLKKTLLVHRPWLTPSKEASGVGWAHLPNACRCSVKWHHHGDIVCLIINKVVYNPNVLSLPE